MTGPGSASCLQHGWGRENPTQTAPGEALTTRHRTGVQFPPSPQAKGRKHQLPAFSWLTLLDVGHRISVLIHDVLGLLIGPFFLDGFDRLLGQMPVRRLVRHGALPQKKGPGMSPFFSGYASGTATSTMPTKRLPTPSYSLRTSPDSRPGSSNGAWWAHQTKLKSGHHFFGLAASE